LPAVFVCIILNVLYFLLPIVPTVEVSDTTGDEMKNKSLLPKNFTSQ